MIEPIMVQVISTKLMIPAILFVIGIVVLVSGCTSNGSSDASATPTPAPASTSYGIPTNTQTMGPGSHIACVMITRVSPTVVRVKTTSGDISLLKSGSTAADATYTVADKTNSTLGAACDQSGSTANPNYAANTENGYMYFLVNSNDYITVYAHFTDGTNSTAFTGIIV